MDLTAVAALFADIEEPELLAWIDRGWVRPAEAPVFAEIDVARVRLIHDLRTLMRIEDETIPMILSLLDQVYTLRGQLRALMRAVDAQPVPVREAILSGLK